jgi:hypothetical protein
MDLSKILKSIYFSGIDTKCYTCSQKISIPRSHCYNVENAHFIGLTKSIFPDFDAFINKQFIYPIAWEEKENDSNIIYSLCSHKCARGFWHNWRCNDSDSDEDYEESECKKMRLD